MNIISLKNILNKISFKDKKLMNVIIWVVIAICALIAISSFGGGKKQASEQKTTASSGLSPPDTVTEYGQALQKQLEDILSNVKGAGKVKVMITLENGSEKVYAKDVTSTEKQDDDKAEGANKSSSELQRADKVITSGKMGDSGGGLVVKEVMPKVAGVIVLASGAADENVKFELYEASKAVLGVAGHRIKVVNSKNN